MSPKISVPKLYVLDDPRPHLLLMQMSQKRGKKSIEKMAICISKSTSRRSLRCKTFRRKTSFEQTILEVLRFRPWAYAKTQRATSAGQFWCRLPGQFLCRFLANDSRRPDDRPAQKFGIRQNRLRRRRVGSLLPSFSTKAVDSASARSSFI